MIDPLEDEISKIELIDHMGSDLTVVNAARVSYDKESSVFSNSDTKLLKYLASHGHWTPFSQPQLQFRIKMPIFIAREWYRHTVGFTRNEVSRRYVDSKPEFYVPTQLRNKALPGQSKQGSHGVNANSEVFIEAMTRESVMVTEMYEKMIEYDIAPEQARIILPVGTYTEFIETASLYAYARLCKLRIQPDAQLETRKYAEAVSSLIAPLFPVSWAELAS